MDTFYPKVNKAREVVLHTECSASGNHNEQMDCANYCRATNANRCMHERFEFLCTWSPYESNNNNINRAEKEQKWQ